ncbi:beta family protein [Amycolatopsis thermoflava]|uniref:beta family protein n=1 Tax=Amycolatopsis thermoflava TaxID=84480 RepID=UPI000486A79E|nr:hypothetical protein [Amycolatopsis thermoflava]
MAAERLDDFTVLVALRAKEGEFEALRRIEGARQLTHVQPLIDFDAFTSSPAAQLSRIEAVARALHRFGRHLMVDAAEIREPSRFGLAGPLGELANRLSDPVDLLDGDYPVPFIPVVRDDTPDEAVTNLGRLADEIGIGAAVRIHVPLRDRSSVARLVDRLRIDVGLVDVIVDLRYVDQVAPQRVEQVRAVLDLVRVVGPVRSTVLLSGSIPRTLNRTDLWQQPRYEEQLWNEVVAAGAGDLRFGDYGVVHPIAGPGFRSKHVAVKYSCPAGWVYSRQRLTEDEHSGADSSLAYTLRRTCRRLVTSEHFAGPRFSWGDREVAAAADGRGNGLGRRSKPVAIATSHHLAYLAGRDR